MSDSLTPDNLNNLENLGPDEEHPEHTPIEQAVHMEVFGHTVTVPANDEFDLDDETLEEGNEHDGEEHEAEEGNEAGLSPDFAERAARTALVNKETAVGKFTGDYVPFGKWMEDGQAGVQNAMINLLLEDNMLHHYPNNLSVNNGQDLTTLVLGRDPLKLHVAIKNEDKKVVLPLSYDKGSFFVDPVELSTAFPDTPESVKPFMEKANTIIVQAIHRQVGEIASGLTYLKEQKPGIVNFFKNVLNVSSIPKDERMEKEEVLEALVAVPAAKKLAVDLARESKLIQRAAKQTQELGR